MEKATVYQTITLLSNSETVSKQRGGMCPAAGGCHGDAHLKIENSFEAMHLIFATYVLIFNINQMFCPAADLCVFLHFINWHTPWLDLFCLYLYIVYLDPWFRFLVGFWYFWETIARDPWDELTFWNNPRHFKGSWHLGWGNLATVQTIVYTWLALCDTKSCIPKM